jgi:FMN reductase
LKRPHFVALGGTTRRNSSTERALLLALSRAEELGARVTLLGAEALALPSYAPEIATRTENAVRLVAAIRDADALIVGSPGYHGSFSGLVKNALDYVEDTSKDERVYLSGMPVGCIATAAGWQAAVATMNHLRAVIHALRGWPTPLGVAINSIPDREGDDPIASKTVKDQLQLMVDQQFFFLA